MNTSLTTVSHYARSVRGLIYPNSCVFCNDYLSTRSSLPLCGTCESILILNKPPYCAQCGHHCKIDRVCPDCAGLEPSPLRSTYFLFKHQSLARKLLYRFKINQAPQVMPLVQHLMRHFLRTAPARFFDAELIVPVPPHRRQILRMLRPSSHIIAELLSELSGKPAVAALKRVKTVLKQSALPRSMRLQNPEGSLGIVQHRLPHVSSVLLVDDVYTTGATARSCARALLEEGVKRVSVFTLARG